MSSTTTLLTGLAWSSTIYFANLSNYVLLHDGGIWSTNGTVAGTVRVATWQNSTPLAINVVNNVGYTLYSPTFGNYRPLRSDGTLGGTVVMTNAPVSPGLTAVGQNAAGHSFHYNTVFLRPQRLCGRLRRQELMLTLS